VLRHRVRARATLSVDAASTLARSMGLIAMFGIENSGLALAVNLLLLFLVVIWLALVYWTYSDAHRRIADPMLVACATPAPLFPFHRTVLHSSVPAPPVPLHRDDRLPDRPPAGIPRRCARARARDRRRTGPARRSRAPALPVLRLRGGEGLPALPGLAGGGG